MELSSCRAVLIDSIQYRHHSPLADHPWSSTWKRTEQREKPVFCFVGKLTFWSNILENYHETLHLDIKYTSHPLCFYMWWKSFLVRSRQNGLCRYKYSLCLSSSDRLDWVVILQALGTSVTAISKSAKDGYVDDFCESVRSFAGAVSRIIIILPQVPCTCNSACYIHVNYVFWHELCAKQKYLVNLRWKWCYGVCVSYRRTDRRTDQTLGINGIANVSGYNARHTRRIYNSNFLVRYNYFVLW